MCGIAGVVGNRDDGPDLVASMLDALAHRGPDARSSTRPAPQVTLGHVRLSIIDLSAVGTQPLVDHYGNHLAFNGEIYNYVELRAQLADGYPFRTHTDTEVILAAYARWGAACVDRLIGMFAFALWDARSGRVLLARDRLGIKPLYVVQLASGPLLFGSEIKALLATELVSRRPNGSRLFDFLAVRMLDHSEETMFADVRQLAPGTVRWVAPTGELGPSHRYWRFPYVRESERRPDSPTLVADFRALLDDVVRLHLRSDVVMGALVSGGLDSSTLACLSADRVPARDQFHLFSARLRQPTSENALITDVQHATRGAAHERVHNGQGFVQDFARVLYHHDEPFADASMYAHFDLCREARRAGVKVLLSGNGGDEVFCGYHFYLFALLGHRLRQGHLGDWLALLRHVASSTEYGLASLLERSISHALPQPARDRARAMVANRSPLFRRGYFDTRHFEFFVPSPDRDLFSQYVLNGLERYTLPGFLHYEDRNSMAWGVEVRVPFLNHRLLEFAASMRPDVLVGPGRTKDLLRRAVEGRVPAAVLAQREKHGFAAPLAEFLNEARGTFTNEALGWFEDVPFLDADACRAALRGYFSGERRVAMTELWRATCAAAWYQMFIRRTLAPGPARWDAA